MKQLSLLFFSVAVLVTASCARVGSSFYVHVPNDAANTCKSECAKLDLDFGALGIMGEHVGCVCQPAKITTSQQDQNTSAGSIMMLMAEEATIRGEKIAGGK